MRSKKVDTSVERELLTAMIVSDAFLSRIDPILDLDYLELPPVRRVAGWVREYYRNYRCAPRATVQSMFDENSGSMSEGESEWTAQFLQELSDGHRRERGHNEGYLFDRCRRYFKRQRLLKDSNRIRDLLERGRLDEAEETWLRGARMAGEQDLGMDPFSGEAVDAFFSQRDYRVLAGTGIGSLDGMTGPLLDGWLLVVMGPMKRGKTFFLCHVTLENVLRGYNVVVISLEQEVEELASRFWCGLGALSLTDEGTMPFPRFVEPARNEDVAYDELDVPAPSRANITRVVDRVNKAGAGGLRLKSYPMGTAGLPEIRSYLDALEVYEGFTPHVIVVDYLGIMAPPHGAEGRDAYNQNSSGLKGLGQERRALVLLAHQGNRKTLEAMNLRPNHVPEDVRILGNLDVLVGLNQTESEMDANIMRLNILMHRHRKFSRMKQTKVLQQFGAAQFALDDMLIDAPVRGRDGQGDMAARSARRDQLRSERRDTDER